MSLSGIRLEEEEIHLEIMGLCLLFAVPRCCTTLSSPVVALGVRAVIGWLRAHAQRGSADGPQGYFHEVCALCAMYRSTSSFSERLSRYEYREWSNTDSSSSYDEESSARVVVLTNEWFLPDSLQPISLHASLYSSPTPQSRFQQFVQEASLP